MKSSEILLPALPYPTLLNSYYTIHDKLDIRPTIMWRTTQCHETRRDETEERRGEWRHHNMQRDITYLMDTTNTQSCCWLHEQHCRSRSRQTTLYLSRRGMHDVFHKSQYPYYTYAYTYACNVFNLLIRTPEAYDEQSDNEVTSVILIDMTWRLPWFHLDLQTM
jgi:hypothetical protein